MSAARLCHFLSHPDNLWAFCLPDFRRERIETEEERDEGPDEGIPPVVEIFTLR